MPPAPTTGVNNRIDRPTLRTDDFSDVVRLGT